MPWGSGEFLRFVLNSTESGRFLDNAHDYHALAQPRATIIPHAHSSSATYASDTTHVQSACSPVHTRSL